MRVHSDKVTTRIGDKYDEEHAENEPLHFF